MKSIAGGLCVYAVVFWKPAGLMPMEWANFAKAVTDNTEVNGNWDDELFFAPVSIWY